MKHTFEAITAKIMKDSQRLEGALIAKACSEVRELAEQAYIPEGDHNLYSELVEIQVARGLLSLPKLTSAHKTAIERVLAPVINELQEQGISMTLDIHPACIAGSDYVMDDHIHLNLSRSC